MAFRENLCEMLTKRGVSSYKFAKEIGVHVSTVTNWKNGASPKMEHVSKISNYFGVSLDELLAEEKE